VSGISGVIDKCDITRPDNFTHSASEKRSTTNDGFSREGSPNYGHQRCGRPGIEYGYRFARFWLGGSEHLSSSLDSVLSFPNHAGNWSRSSIIYQSIEKWFTSEIFIMFLELFFAWLC
jgi:hypothetical protein